MAGLSEITNYVQLTDDVGTSGQPTTEQFAAIAAAGYGAVVNLALPSSDHAIADEGRVVSELGMTYVHIPVKFDDPKPEELRTFCGVMEALAGAGALRYGVRPDIRPPVHPAESGSRSTPRGTGWRSSSCSSRRLVSRGDVPPPEMSL